MNLHKKTLNFTGTMLVSALVIFSSCSSDRSSEEAQKLLEKQAQVLEQEQESIENILNEFQTTRDSLLNSQNQLQKTKQDVELEIQKISEVQTDLATTMKKEQEEALEAEKKRLQQRIESLSDSLNDVA